MLGKVLLVCAVFIAVAVDSETKLRPFQITEKIIADGFPSETHHVTTFDGYILEMHRIPHGRENATGTADRPVVFLMHGLMGASRAYIGLGPEHAIAYNLADAGFDVWMGNARGNPNSRAHITLNPDHETEKFTFFDFTFEEIGLHDLPTMIDYVLEVTGKKNLHYIGHSQGGTVFLVMASLRPEYNDKIRSAHLLAGVGYQQYFPDQQLATAAQEVDIIYNIAIMMGIVEVFPGLLENLIPSAEYRTADYCTGNLEQSYMCELFGMTHLLRDLSNNTEEFSPAGASLKQTAHYGQNIRDKLFRRYHHGTDGNMQVYGLKEPPLYNLGLITADVTMHYSLSDNLLDERDVLAMAADMPNTKVRKVARDSFLHSDYVVALDAKELVTDFIIEAMLNAPETEVQTFPGNDEVVVAGETTESIIVAVTPEPIAISTPASASSAVVNLYLVLFVSIVLYFYGQWLSLSISWGTSTLAEL